MPAIPSASVARARLGVLQHRIQNMAATSARPAAAGKVHPDAAAALRGVVADNQTLAVGGFGLCGLPAALIAALRRRSEARRLGQGGVRPFRPRWSPSPYKKQSPLY